MPFAGSQAFLDDLLGRRFLSSKNQIEFMKGEDVNGHHFMQHGFNRPVLVKDVRGLRIKVPESSFTLKDVVDHTDPDMPIEVINVRSQDSSKMRLGDFVMRFLSVEREDILNVLSLEFSKTNLARIVQPPHVVSELSLVENCWPDDNEEPGETSSVESLPAATSQRGKPCVQKYCLMSMAGSYTDFHVDFGGSSVWYHVVWGEKIFYLVPPTKDNLNKFWKWHNIADNRNLFFPDSLAKTCTMRLKDDDQEVPVPPVYRLKLHAGETVLLPAGWIHSVYTPCDSLVFGGNFLTAISVPMQLNVYRMEEISETDIRFLFPYFERVHWYYADQLVGRFQNCIQQGVTPPKHELEAATCLNQTLPSWLERRHSLDEAQRFDYLPKKEELELTYSGLLAELGRLVRQCSPKSLIIDSSFKSEVKTTAPAAATPKKQRSRKQVLIPTAASEAASPPPVKLEPAEEEGQLLASTSPTSPFSSPMAKKRKRRSAQESSQSPEQKLPLFRPVGAGIAAQLNSLPATSPVPFVESRRPAASPHEVKKFIGLPALDKKVDQCGGGKRAAARWPNSAAGGHERRVRRLPADSDSESSLEDADEEVKYEKAALRELRMGVRVEVRSSKRTPKPNRRYMDDFSGDSHGSDCSDGRTKDRGSGAEPKADADSASLDSDDAHMAPNVARSRRHRFKSSSESEPDQGAMITDEEDPGWDLPATARIDRYSAVSARPLPCSSSSSSSKAKQAQRMKLATPKGSGSFKRAPASGSAKQRLAKKLGLK